MSSYSRGVGGIYVRAQWFQEISSGTTGTITNVPEGAEVVLDTFGGGVDALISGISNSLPDLTSVKTSGNTVIATTLNSSNQYALSGTPSAYPVAIVYTYQVQLASFDVTQSLTGLQAVIDAVSAINVAAAGAIMDSDFTSNGVMVRASDGGYASRTLTGTTNQVTVTDGDGVSGNPTLSLPQNIHTAASPQFSKLTLTNNLTVASISASGTVNGRDVSTDGAKLDTIEASADVTDAANVAAAGAIMNSDFPTSGHMVRTGSGTYVSRTVTGTANQVVVTNGSGVSGNPTLSLPQDIATTSTVTFNNVRVSSLTNGFVPYAITTTKQLTNSNMFYGTGASTTGLAIGGTDVRGECTIQRTVGQTFFADTDPTDFGRSFVMQNNSTSNAANLYSNITMQANPNGNLAGGRILGDIRYIRKTANQSDAFFMISSFLQGAIYRDLLRIGFDHNCFRSKLIIGSTTLAPVNMLDVSGGFVIGSSYAAVNTAPTNGGLIQGQLAIGSTSSSAWATLGNSTNSTDHIRIKGEREYIVKCSGSGVATYMVIKPADNDKQLHLSSADDSRSVVFNLSNTKVDSTIIQTEHGSRTKFGGLSVADSTLELEEVKAITANTADGKAGTLTLDPGYSTSGPFSLTVTRHNYIECQNPSTAVSGGASLAITDACLARFDAAAGTHKAVDAAATKATPGAYDGFVKINVNGAIGYIGYYLNKTS